MTKDEIYALIRIVVKQWCAPNAFDCWYHYTKIRLCFQGRQFTVLFFDNLICSGCSLMWQSPKEGLKHDKRANQRRSGKSAGVLHGTTL